MNEFALTRRWGPTPNYPNALKYKRPNKDFIVIAGPCSVEDKNQINKLAKIVKSCGATHLRGGVFRAGTYPGKNFGWVDEELIQDYHEAAQKNGLKNIIEVLDYTDLSFRLISKFCDAFQVGARSMQNYSLLKKLGRSGKPVFIKRHPGCNIDEFLGAAEYILSNGGHPILIERGSSTFNTHVRWDLSVSMIPAIQKISQIPIIIDASHGTGRRDLVEPMTLAGVAAGADGILVECHYDPENSLSDKDQAIDPKSFKNLMSKVNKIRKVR